MYIYTPVHIPITQYIYIIYIYIYIYNLYILYIYIIYIYIYIYSHTPSLFDCRMAPPMQNPGYTTEMKVLLTRLISGVYMHLFVEG